MFQGVAGIVYCFMVYSFFGWLIENTYSLMTKRIFFKPNLWIGPFKPMYGIAPIILLSFVNNSTSWITFLMLCLLVPTVVEYVSGVMLFRLTHRRWWDYSKVPLQLHGHVCLPFSLCWLLLSVLCVQYVHPVLVTTLEHISVLWKWIWPLAVLYSLAEIFLVFRRYPIQIIGVQKTKKHLIN